MGAKLILGSKSPRRKFIMEQAGFNFEIMVSEEEEVLEQDLPLTQIPQELAVQKAEHILPQIEYDDFQLVTADTVVILHDEIIGKPKDLEDARRILRQLSGEIHEVVSGVCIRTPTEEISFSDFTQVAFKKLTENEIDYYVNNHEVLDKAGAYAIQDWIGIIGIRQIEGSYYNVMGLPIHRVYAALNSLR